MPHILIARLIRRHWERYLLLESQLSLLPPAYRDFGNCNSSYLLLIRIPITIINRRPSSKVPLLLRAESRLNTSVKGEALHQAKNPGYRFQSGG